jgi:hypothetical protein
MHPHANRAGRSVARLGLELLEGRDLPSVTLPAVKLSPPAPVQQAPAKVAVASPASAAPVGFTAHWSVSRSPVVTGSSAGTANGKSTGSVAFALAHDGAGSVRPGGPGTSIAAAVLTSNSAGNDAFPDTFHSPFGLRLHLRDDASGAAADLTFGGTINGKLTARKSSLTANLEGPLSQQVKLGGHVYTVTFGSRTVPVPAPGAAPVAVNVTVQVAPH